jgi:hypothetical protein
LLPKPLKLQRGHHKAMPYEEVPTFVLRLQEREASAAGRGASTELLWASAGPRCGTGYKMTADAQFLIGMICTLISPAFATATIALAISSWNAKRI